MEVPLSRGIFSSRRNENARRQVVTDMMLKNQGNVAYGIGRFKFTPVFLPEPMDVRQIAAACTHCLKEKANELDEEVKAHGIQNCFDVETSNVDNRWIIRCCPLFFYFWDKGRAAAGGFKRVHKIPREINMAWGESLAIRKDDILSVVQSMTVPSPRVWLDRVFTRLWGWLAGRLLKFLFEGVCVHKGEIELIERIHKTDLPIIYLPNRKSFLDSVIIGWSLIHAGLPAPYHVTSSHLWYLTRWFHGIGIPSRKGRKSKDVVNGSALWVALHSLLTARASLQVFLEPHRSRTGMSSTELYEAEILHIVYDAFVRKEIEDAYFVPVNVSYEILPEEIGTPDLDDGFCSRMTDVKFVKCLWNASRKRLGKVRVTYGQPFSLREFTLSMQNNKKVIRAVDDFEGAMEESYLSIYDARELNWDSKYGSTASLASLYADLSLVASEVPETEDEFRKAFVEVLAFHTIYEGQSATAAMPTHLVAFILITKYRRGVTLEVLYKEVKQLRKWLTMKRKDIGFCGDTKAAVIRGLELLGPDLITCFTDAESKSVMVAPTSSALGRRKLGYYANTVMPFFAMEAIIALAIYALVGDQLVALKGLDFEIRVKDDELMFHSDRIYEALTAGFYLHPPCLTKEGAMRHAIESLNSDGVVSMLRREVGHRFRHSDDDDSESEEYNGPFPLKEAGGKPDFFFAADEYKVFTTAETCDRLIFLRNLITCYMRAYSVIATSLFSKLSVTKEVLAEGVDYIQLRGEILDDALKCKFDYNELFFMDTVKSVLLTFEQHEILYSVYNPKLNRRRIVLSEKYVNQASRKNIINGLLQYVF